MSDDGYKNTTRKDFISVIFAPNNLRAKIQVKIASGYFGHADSLPINDKTKRPRYQIIAGYLFNTVNAAKGFESQKKVLQEVIEKLNLISLKDKATPEDLEKIEKLKEEINIQANRLNKYREMYQSQVKRNRLDRWESKYKPQIDRLREQVNLILTNPLYPRALALYSLTDEKNVKLAEPKNTNERLDPTRKSSNYEFFEKFKGYIKLLTELEDRYKGSLIQEDTLDTDEKNEETLWSKLEIPLRSLIDKYSERIKIANKDLETVEQRYKIIIDTINDATRKKQQEEIINKEKQKLSKLDDIIISIEIIELRKKIRAVFIGPDGTSFEEFKNFLITSEKRALQYLEPKLNPERKVIDVTKGTVQVIERDEDLDMIDNEGVDANNEVISKYNFIYEGDGKKKAKVKRSTYEPVTVIKKKDRKYAKFIIDLTISSQFIEKKTHLQSLEEFDKIYNVIPDVFKVFAVPDYFIHILRFLNSQSSLENYDLSRCIENKSYARGIFSKLYLPMGLSISKMMNWLVNIDPISHFIVLANNTTPRKIDSNNNYSYYFKPPLFVRNYKNTMQMIRTFNNILNATYKQFAHLKTSVINSRIVKITPKFLSSNDVAAFYCDLMITLNKKLIKGCETIISEKVKNMKNKEDKEESIKKSYDSIKSGLEKDEVLLIWMFQQEFVLRSLYIQTLELAHFTFFGVTPAAPFLEHFLLPPKKAGLSTWFFTFGWAAIIIRDLTKEEIEFLSTINSSNGIKNPLNIKFLDKEPKPTGKGVFSYQDLRSLKPSVVDKTFTDIFSDEGLFDRTVNNEIILYITKEEEKYIPKTDNAILMWNLSDPRIRSKHSIYSFIKTIQEKYNNFRTENKEFNDLINNNDDILEGRRDYSKAKSKAPVKKTKTDKKKTTKTTTESDDSSSGEEEDDEEEDSGTDNSQPSLPDTSVYSP